VGQVGIKTRVIGQRLTVCIFQYIETFGECLHRAVFDAVVDHLDEMAGAARAAMKIAELRALVAAIAARRARHIAEPRTERLAWGIEPINGGFRPANHHAVAALEAPEAATECPNNSGKQ